MIFKHPFFASFAFSIGLFLCSPLNGQNLSSSLQLDPQKLTGFFFGDETHHSESLSSAMIEFAENAHGLQLIYVASERNVAKFYKLKATGFSSNPPSSRGFYGFVNKTQIGEALARNFKVTVFPSLLICNAKDRVLDENGLSSLKSQRDPYAYWKSLDSAGKTSVASKPLPQKKSGYDVEIDKLEIRRLQIISSLNDLIYAFSVSINNGTVDDAKALKTLSLEGNKWISYSDTLSKFAGEKVKELEERIERTSSLSVPIRKLVVPKLEQQKKILEGYSKQKFPFILSKMDAFNKLVGQCDELLRTADVLGRDQSLVLVKKLLSEFQNIHFPTPDQ